MNTFDPFVPQAYNVDIGHEREGADEMPRHDFEPPAIPYEVPVVVLIEPDTNLYPTPPYGVWINA